MTELVVRRLLIDLEAPIARHWCGGDPLRTAWFNALSMSFPTGEQFFIDTVRDGLQALPAAAQAGMQAEVRAFIGQEATHRRVHSLFNAHLERQGLVNDWGARNSASQKLLAGIDVRHPVAITAANEHITAMVAEWLLGNPDILAGSEDRLRTMWLWHCAEEAEHKATAFDLYLALGGNHAWRSKWLKRVTFIFVRECLRQTVLNLHKEGALWRWSTWRSAGRLLLGRRGLVRHCWRPWRAYLRADFHPQQQHSARSADWLRDHASQFSIVSPA